VLGDVSGMVTVVVSVLGDVSGMVTVVVSVLGDVSGMVTVVVELVVVSFFSVVVDTGRTVVTGSSSVVTLSVSMHKTKTISHILYKTVRLKKFSKFQIPLSYCYYELWLKGLKAKS
jgi:hypothetical protein